LSFDFFGEKPVVGEPSDEQSSSEALSGRQRRHWHNRRRCDPLGQGQPCTWRTRLIKVAARVR